MRSTRAAKLWLFAVLPLLAGLFAMHGLQAANGAGHEMPMVASASMPEHAGPGQPMGGHPMGGHPMAAPAAAELAASGMSKHDGAVCLALLVLTLVVLFLTRAPWLVRVRDAPRAVRPPRTTYRRPSRDPPVYLRLCVFRL